MRTRQSGLAAIAVATICFWILWSTTDVRASLLSGSPLDGLERLRDGKSMRSSSADSNWRDGNADARPIPPGETLTIADLQGPGVITHIWFTIAADDPHYHRSMTLRMYWDGETEPSVESPIGDFFAVGHGMRTPVNSLPVQVSSDGRALNCYWPMPFAKLARLTVTNDSGTYRVRALYWYVDWVKKENLRPDTAYFHAQYRQEKPCKPGDYLIFDGEGRGHYVGTVLSVHMSMGSWFGEGDDRFYIDGEEEPSLRGTGTEDYFCDAWGFRHFNNPFYGVSVWEGYEPLDRGTAYRWHITDPVIFNKSLKVTIEHKGVYFDESGKVISHFKERPDFFSSVALWYQVGKAKRFATLLPASERILRPDVHIEGESLLEEGKPKQPHLQIQKLGGWSAGAQAWLFVHEPGAKLDVAFSVAKEGDYYVEGNFTYAGDYGIYQAGLDGKPIGKRLDFYNDGVIRQKVRFGRHKLTAGEHLLQFRSTGDKNPRSTSYLFGLDDLSFWRVP